MLEKFKSLIQNDQVFFGILVVLVGLGSFFLGRASVEESNQRGVNSASVSLIQNTIAESSPISGKVTETRDDPEPLSEVSLVASKSGQKYHLKTCPGAKQIKPENLISFASVQAAQAAGYTPAGNCPGL